MLADGVVLPRDWQPRVAAQLDRIRDVPWDYVRLDLHPDALSLYNADWGGLLPTAAFANVLYPRCAAALPRVGLTAWGSKAVLVRVSRVPFSFSFFLFCELPRCAQKVRVKSPDALIRSLSDCGHDLDTVLNYGTLTGATTLGIFPEPLNVANASTFFNGPPRPIADPEAATQLLLRDVKAGLRDASVAGDL